MVMVILMLVKPTNVFYGLKMIIELNTVKVWEVLNVNVHLNKMIVLDIGNVKILKELLKNSLTIMMPMVIKSLIYPTPLKKNISLLLWTNVILMVITFLLNVKFTNVLWIVKMIGELKIVPIWDQLPVIVHGLNDLNDLIF